MSRIFCLSLLFIFAVLGADDALVEIRGETLRGYGVLVRHGEGAAVLTSAHVWLLNDRPEVIDGKGRKIPFKSVSLAADRDLAMVVCGELPEGVVKREVVAASGEERRSETTFYMAGAVKRGDSGKAVYDGEKRVVGIVTGLEDTRGFATDAAVEPEKWHLLDAGEKKRVFGLIAELRRGVTVERGVEIRRMGSDNPALDALLREALKAFQKK